MDGPGRKRKRVLTLPPSSNGCITCRSRRVKCDETRPFCRRCVQARRTCKGYAAAWPSANAPPEPAEETRLTQQLESQVLQVSKWKSERAQILAEYFELSYPPVLAAARKVSVLGAIMEIPPTSAVLISTLETICFSHLSNVSRSPRYTCQSYISYAQTLKLLQAALARGPLVVDMVRRRELLTSIVLLAQLPDSITNNQAVHESWRVHLWAAIEYAAASAPAVLDFDHPLEAKLMHSIQVNGTLLAISRRTALPVHPRWLENKRLWYQGVTRPFFHVPSALEKADSALCKEDNALDIEILSHELEQLRLETELGEQPWRSARTLTKLEDVDLDQDIEEHAAVTKLAAFDSLYVFTEFVAARRFTTTNQLMLVIECTLLRLLHSARDAGTHIPTSRTIEQIEANAFRLASNICMASHHISRMQTIGNAMLVQLGLSMARQFFEEHGDQAQMEWCDACLAANSSRLVRIEAALPPSRCRINAIIPGWVAACRYQMSGLYSTSGTITEAGD